MRDERGSASGWRFFFPNGPGLAKRFIWNPIESSWVERMAVPKVLACRWRSASCWSLRPKRFAGESPPVAEALRFLRLPNGKRSPLSFARKRFLLESLGEALRREKSLASEALRSVRNGASPGPGARKEAMAAPLGGSLRSFTRSASFRLEHSPPGAQPRNHYDRP